MEMGQRGGLVRWLAIVLTSCVLAACNLTGSSMMYPEVVRAGSTIDGTTAVVLVGNGGTQTINYLQFTHSSMPAINVQDITLAPGGIVAVPVPVGTKELELANYTIASRPAGYFTTGASYGYVPVRTPKVDIIDRGLYYIATVLPGQQPNYDVRPNPSMIMKFRNEHREVAGLKPINFNW
jgi:hypothetical protein